MSVSAEKIPTNLTIGINPVNPTINESFHVFGLLTTKDGKPLGNKRVTLESSQKGVNDTEKFSFIGIKVTDREGGYEFFRPVDSPPEFLKITFAGNDEYEPVTSPVIAVRGAGTDHPQIRSNVTGSIMTSTNPQGADIYIDDIMRGITPQKVAGLSEGSHVLRVAKTGYQNETMEAYVTSGIDVYFDISLLK
ncbi:MAG: PEGA domain-containing protein [Methanobacteriota archaeon]